MVKRGKKKKSKKEEGFNLKNQYIKSWNYLLDSLQFIKTIVILFFVFTLIGFFFPVPEVFVEKLIEFLREIFDKTKDLSQIELIKFIFLNNLKSSLFGLFLGIFLGVFPILVTIMNGYILGFVAFLSVSEGGFIVLWKLFPHGIFELPAIFISLGLGLRLGTLIFKNKKLKSFRDHLGDSTRVFVLVVIPLLALAAIIEGILIASIV